MYPSVTLGLLNVYRWLEKGDSGMIVAEIGIPSGFSTSAYGIAGHSLLKRSEIEPKFVALYFDEVCYN